MRVLLLALALAGCEPRFRGPPVRPPAQYGVRGIDVSHHQGWVDWPRVAESREVSFVFVKATEGTTHVDRRFHRNWAGAREAGLRVGAYHYFSLCRTGADQAAHFIATVPRVPDGLPPVVDIEADRRCNRDDRLARTGVEVAAWVDAVQAHFGVRPLVYASSSFERTHLAPAGIGGPLWLAAYTRSPRNRGWTFWQYTDRGRVPGIRGPVDGNVFHGTLEALHRIGGEPTP
ncbi:MAG: GH25 family lysozyme [Myxococcota bacterium]